MLSLEVELLGGAYRASLPDGSRAEWPPHPERVFSALVQAWGDGGRNDDEKVALEWLEAQPAPLIEAAFVAASDMREAWTVYVPPNDLENDLRAMPELRPRQARVFRAVSAPKSTDGRAHVRYAWDADAGPDTVEALRALAHRIASLGHSSSFARFQFANKPAMSAGFDFDSAHTWRPHPSGHHALRMPYRGRLADLERWFSTEGGKRLERPRSMSTQRYHLGVSTSVDCTESAFGGEHDWFVFEGVSNSHGFSPDVLGLAHITARMRDALLASAGKDAPELLSGHAGPNVPSRRPHVAIVPLLNVGWEHADGELLGLAVCIPRRTPEDERRAVLRALAEFSPLADDDDAPRGALVFRHGTWVLERTGAPSRHSLRPSRYCQASTTWATVTPLALDRFPDGGDPLEEAKIVADACVHIDLPEPRSIEFHKHSVVRGAPSCNPDRGVRHRPGWSFPDGCRFKDRPRRHVVLEFDCEVRGPVLLGAGRYQGFGLCLPLSRPERSP